MMEYLRFFNFFFAFLEDIMEGMKKFTMGIGDIATVEMEVRTFDIHTHNYYEMTLYEPFEGKICINGRDVETREGVATLIAPLDFHEIKVNEKRGKRCIKISFAADVPKGVGQAFSGVVRGVGDFEWSLFREIAANVNHAQYAEKLIECAIHMFLAKGEEILLAKHTNGQLISKTVVGYINDHLGEDIDLDTVAKHFGVTPQYLSRVFRLNLGVNFSKYLIDIRLRYAEKLIRAADKSLTEICFLSGFGNYSHFSRSCKSKYSVTPKEYRENAHKM